MSKRFSGITFIVMLTLIAMPPVLLLGKVLLEDFSPALIGLGGVAVCALLIGFVPGRASMGKRRLPLRMLISGMVAAGITAGIGMLGSGTLNNVFPFFSWVAGLIMGALMLIWVRLSVVQPEGMRLLPVGAAAYLISGIALWAIKDTELNWILFAGAAVFFIINAFLLNTGSLSIGYAAHKSVKPPVSIRRGNRALIAGFILLVAFIAAFDQIRAWATRTTRAAILAVMRFLVWLANLFPMQSTEGPAEGGGMPDFSGLAPQQEPSMVWEVLQRIFMVIALIVLAFALYKAVRVLARKVRKAIDWLAAYFKQFAQAVGEDYEDERESLFDMAEIKSAMEERAKRQLKRLLSREKRWEQMDNRERVRSIVRGIYRRAGTSVSRLESMTIRESSKVLGIGQATPDMLSALYEKARYSETMPEHEEVEALRRAVK